MIEFFGLLALDRWTGQTLIEVSAKDQKKATSVDCLSSRRWLFYFLIDQAKWNHGLRLRLVRWNCIYPSLFFPTIVGFVCIYFLKPENWKKYKPTPSEGVKKRKPGGINFPSKNLSQLEHKDYNFPPSKSINDLLTMLTCTSMIFYVWLEVSNVLSVSKN